MARIRSIKPTFWTDEKVGLMPRAVRLTFLGLISAMADDHGRLVANARIIRGAVYPYDDDITVPEVESHIQMLVAANRVVRYTVNGDDYLAIRHWTQHQKVDKPSKSLLPAPPPDLEPPKNDQPPVVEPSSSFPGSFDERSRPSGAERSGAEGNGRDMERSGADADSATPPTSDDLDPFTREQDRAAPPAPLVELPAEAHRFVEQVYSLGTPKRQLDVRRQLYDTLDPRGRGARLRRGVMVKARSPEHLAECCRAVLDDPPRIIDAAIVLVLEKLLDPPKGPTPSEIHKAGEDRRVADEGAYARAARAAAVRWAHEHAEEYDGIRKAATAEFPEHATNDFMRMTYESVLTQRCAKAAAFPDFDTWTHARAAS